MTASKVLSFILLGLITINLTNAAPIGDVAVNENIKTDVNKQGQDTSLTNAVGKSSKGTFGGYGPITINGRSKGETIKLAKMGGNGQNHILLGGERSELNSRTKPIKLQLILQA